MDRYLLKLRYGNARQNFSRVTMKSDWTRGKLRNRTADGDCLTFKLSLRNSINDKVLEYPILYLDRTADVDIVKHYLTRL